MRNIEITTSQNVTVQYGLATVWERAIALLIDLLVMGAVSLLLLGIQMLFFSNLILYFTTYPFLLLYSLLFEQFNNGQSIGKRAMNIRVIRVDGENVHFLDYLMRWVFRGLDIYFSAGTVAILSSSASNYGQRVGDLLANTVVVNVSKNERLRLANLLKLHTLNHQQVSYPQVIKMTEETMLIVKETLSKCRELANSAHNEAFTLLVKKMEKELAVPPAKDPELFLRTLLKDYIILTR